MDKMNDLLNEPVQLSQGIELNKLFTSQTEFQIDVDFKKGMSDSFFDNDDSMLDSDMDNSDCEDILNTIERSTEQMLLASPEYHSFCELSAKMIDCVPSGDVKMLIIEEGDGPLVPVDAEVTLHYAAYWEKAKIPFDSTLTMNSGIPLMLGYHIPASDMLPNNQIKLMLPALLRLRLGTGSALLGLEIGLTAVRGPKASFHLLLQPKVAWGEMGAPPRVKPEPALFVIVLYDVKDVQAAARFNDLPMEEQRKFEVTLRTVKSLHGQAKDLFSRRKYARAIKNYQQSTTVLRLSQPQCEAEEAEVKSLRVTALVNLAVCFHRIGKPKHVLHMCEAIDQIIDIERHCKALFYCGRAHESLGRREQALKYYNMALKLEPKNTEIGKALSDFDCRALESAVKEKAMWQTVFKPSPHNKKVVYGVDADFQDGVREMCKSLAGSGEYAKFDMPSGLTRREVECLKSLVGEFEGLTVDEESGEKGKRVTIVNQPK